MAEVTRPESNGAGIPERCGPFPLVLEWVLLIRWFETLICPQTTNTGDVSGTREEVSDALVHLTHMAVEGDGPWCPSPSCLCLRGRVPLFWGYLFTHLQALAHSLRGLAGPCDLGMNQSVGACRVPLGLTSSLSSHRLVTLAPQSWPP